MLIPHRIFALWLQGEEKAPPLVKMCLRRWRRLNPTYELKVLDLADANEILKDFPLTGRQMHHQAFSDVLRINLMKGQGGVWVDATTFPACPLDDWLPEAAKSGFFAFEGHRRPVDVDSWFLAAAPGHTIPLLWWQAIERYWYKPRSLITFVGEWASNYNFDPLSFFCSDDAIESDSYPYYWLMYMFTHLLNTRDDFGLAWEKVGKRPGFDSHAIQRMCNEDPNVPDRELVEASLKTHVQKLSYRDRHTARWLSLDKAFGDVDTMYGVDFNSYGIYESKYSLYERARFAAPMRFRAAGGRMLRHFAAPT